MVSGLLYISASCVADHGRYKSAPTQRVPALFRGDETQVLRPGQQGAIRWRRPQERRHGVPFASCE